MGGPATIDGREVEHTDNFFVAPFMLDGLEWPSCEHCFQALKFLGDQSSEATAIVEAIRTAVSGQAAWSMAQKHAELLRPDWEHVKVHAMYRAVAAKYAQYPDFARELADSVGPIETSISTADWQRMNRLILERVREELRPASRQHKKRLAALVALTEPRLQGEAALQELRAAVRPRAPQAGAATSPHP
mmetsp:Transcript_87205/g.260135  ORF Transcript_87205/g.260135 Transcript_87205/m.260135 type:complete len:189 (-) Transcript_87205:347-913(-)